VCEGYEWIGVKNLDDGGLVLFLDDGMWFVKLWFMDWKMVCG